MHDRFVQLGGFGESDMEHSFLTEKSRRNSDQEYEMSILYLCFPLMVFLSIAIKTFAFCA